MTLRIEDDFDGDACTLRLIGHLQAENLPELAALLENPVRSIALDLKEVTLVDLTAIQFLASCSANGTPLRNCPPYVKSWIAEERIR